MWHSVFGARVSSRRLWLSEGEGLLQVKHLCYLCPIVWPHFPVCSSHGLRSSVQISDYCASQSRPRPVLPPQLRQLPLRSGMQQRLLWVGRQRLLQRPEPPVVQRHPVASHEHTTSARRLLEQLAPLGTQHRSPVAAHTERLRSPRR